MRLFAGADWDDGLEMPILVAEVKLWRVSKLIVRNDAGECYPV
jgi:hypothetical protein